MCSLFVFLFKSQSSVLKRSDGKYQPVIFCSLALIDEPDERLLVTQSFVTTTLSRLSLQSDFSDVGKWTGCNLITVRSCTAACNRNELFCPIGGSVTLKFKNLTVLIGVTVGKVPG